MPIVLWTDALIALVIAAIVAYALAARRRPHMLLPWRKIGASAPGMAGAVVLIAFAAVAVLDSLHFKPRLPGKAPNAPAVYSVDVRSVLDVLLESQRTRNERTYSAPFATHAYAKETIEEVGASAGSKAGGIKRDFPRLTYGGAHLKDPNDRGRDIVARLLPALALAVLVWWAVVGALTAISARSQGVMAAQQWGRIWRGETGIAWRAVFLTLAMIAVVAIPAMALSTQYHVLGTDKVGQDVLYLAMKSIRTALVIGGLTTLISLPLGIFAGVAAGYFKGWVDDVITYLYTLLNSIPSVLLIAAAMLLLQASNETKVFSSSAQQADSRLVWLCIILGLTAWTGLARLLRGEALKLRELEYVQAARAFGVTDLGIITRHLFPNVLHIVLISAVMEFSGLVLAEAVLSYIGVGVDPSMYSFGTMINTARLEMAREPMVWWALVAAFAFMFVLVLAANLFADAVRDGFDPRATVGPRAALTKATA